MHMHISKRSGRTASYIYLLLHLLRQRCIMTCMLQNQHGCANRVLLQPLGFEANDYVHLDG